MAKTSKSAPVAVEPLPAPAARARARAGEPPAAAAVPPPSINRPVSVAFYVAMEKLIAELQRASAALANVRNPAAALIPLGRAKLKAEDCDRMIWQSEEPDGTIRQFKLEELSDFRREVSAGLKSAIGIIDGSICSIEPCRIGLIDYTVGGLAVLFPERIAIASAWRIRDSDRVIQAMENDPDRATVDDRMNEHKAACAIAYRRACDAGVTAPGIDARWGVVEAGKLNDIRLWAGAWDEIITCGRPDDAWKLGIEGRLAAGERLAGNLVAWAGEQAELQPVADKDGANEQTPGLALDGDDYAILEVLRFREHDLFKDDDILYDETCRGIKKRTFAKRKKQLLEWGLIQNVPGKHGVKITPYGVKLFDANLAATSRRQ